MDNPSTSLFDHPPTLTDLTDRLHGLLTRTQQVSETEELEEIARELTLLAGYYHLVASRTWRERAGLNPVKIEVWDGLLRMETR